MEKIIALLNLMDNAQQSLPLQVPQLAAVPQQEVLQVDTDLIRFTRTAIKTVYE